MICCRFYSFIQLFSFRDFFYGLRLLFSNEEILFIWKNVEIRSYGIENAIADVIDTRLELDEI